MSEEVAELYTVASARSMYDLGQFVSKRMGQGWTPIGGVAVCKVEKLDFDLLFLQAMVKENG